MAESRKSEHEKAVARLVDKPCSSCSNDREPISLDEIKQGDSDLFLFEQDNKCHCFFVYNLYKYVFDTADVSEKMYVVNAKNPLTGGAIGEDTVRRLHEQYKAWYVRSKDDTSINGIKLSKKDIEEFTDGMETMAEMMRSRGTRPTELEVAHAYAADLIDLSDDEQDIAKAKALYKFKTTQDFK